MKKLIWILNLLIVAVVISCKDDGGPSRTEYTRSSDWTEAEKRKYFQDSLAFRLCNRDSCKGLNSFVNFSNSFLSHIKAKNIQNPVIYAMEEPYIDTTCIDSNQSWFRIIVMPISNKPYCLVIEKKNNRTYLTTKVTNGAAGYFPGLLDISVTSIYSDSVYNNFSRILFKHDFWSLGKDTSIRQGIDGETWMFEGIDKGRYNCIYRWVPLSHGTSVTRDLATVTWRHFNMSKIFDIYTLVHPEDMIEE
jgi:hypothetical protein